MRTTSADLRWVQDARGRLAPDGGDWLIAGSAASSPIKGCRIVRPVLRTSSASHGHAPVTPAILPMRSP